MHVKKKHNGQYPDGTSEKPNLRNKGRVSDNYVLEGEEEDVNDDEGMHIV